MLCSWIDGHLYLILFVYVRLIVFVFEFMHICICIHAYLYLNSYLYFLLIKGVPGVVSWIDDDPEQDSTCALIWSKPRCFLLQMHSIVFVFLYLFVFEFILVFVFLHKYLYNYLITVQISDAFCSRCIQLHLYLD